MRVRVWSKQATLAWVLTTFAAPGIAQIPIGIEFQVNLVTAPGQQRAPAVASDADGDFVVTWHSNFNLDGDQLAVRGRRFSSSGAGVGDEFQVNTYGNGNQYYPAVAMNPAGAFVVAWISRHDGSQFGGIFARRYDSSGAPIGSDFQVNTYTTETQSLPAIAMDQDGDFVVVWHSYFQDGYHWGVFGQRFSSSGSVLGAEFLVNTFTTANEFYPSVAMTAGGAFVVAWENNARDGGSYGVFARRFDSAGGPLAAEFQVNTFTVVQERRPAAAFESDGDFVVTWSRSHPGDGSGDGVFGQRFTSSGSRRGGEFQVNAYTEGNQVDHTVAALGSNRFVVAWSSFNGQDGDGHGVFTRSFHGAPGSTEIQANTFTVNRQDQPAIARSGDGQFVIVWRTAFQDGYGYGIFGQRLELFPTLADLVVQAGQDWNSLANVTGMTGNLAMVEIDGETFLLIPNLAVIDGDLTITGNDGLQVINLSALAEVGAA
jgi:hypothetical protein